VGVRIGSIARSRSIERRLTFRSAEHLIASTPKARRAHPDRRQGAEVSVFGVLCDEGQLRPTAHGHGDRDPVPRDLVDRRALELYLTGRRPWQADRRALELYPPLVGARTLVEMHTLCTLSRRRLHARTARIVLPVTSPATADTPYAESGMRYQRASRPPSMSVNRKLTMPAARSVRTAVRWGQPIRGRVRPPHRPSGSGPAPTPPRRRRCRAQPAPCSRPLPAIPRSSPGG